MDRRIPSLALTGVLLASLAWACGTRRPITTWYYSAWYPKSGAGTQIGFEKARRACLAEQGIAQDPQAVDVNGPVESRFVVCMNTAGWCTDAYRCEKPG